VTYQRSVTFSQTLIYCLRHILYLPIVKLAEARVPVSDPSRFLKRLFIAYAAPRHLAELRLRGSSLLAPGEITPVFALPLRRAYAAVNCYWKTPLLDSRSLLPLNSRHFGNSSFFLYCLSPVRDVSA